MYFNREHLKKIAQYTIDARVRGDRETLLA
jgi:hypothetical protein